MHACSNFRHFPLKLLKYLLIFTQSLESPGVFVQNSKGSQYSYSVALSPPLHLVSIPDKSFCFNTICNDSILNLNLD